MVVRNMLLYLCGLRETAWWMVAVERRVRIILRTSSRELKRFYIPDSQELRSAPGL